MREPSTMPEGLAVFELPRPFVAPALRVLRLANTAIDALFYDVGVLLCELLWRGEVVSTQTSPTPTQFNQFGPFSLRGFTSLDLDALSNPEGCILVVDSTKAPFVQRFDSVVEFIEWANSDGQDVKTVTITGVGSSALGSAAFAWNASMALGQRVAAIVPGYGLADMLEQALGGWFGFGVQDWLGSLAQTIMANTVPETAKIGRNLLISAPAHKEATTGAPEFITGNPASDVLHSILERAPAINTLLGHSKGALVISNALRSLGADVTKRLWVATFGCAISESVAVKHYEQYLGILDALGALNSWGHSPDHLVFTHHSTNIAIAFAMPVAILTRVSVALGHGSESAHSQRNQDRRADSRDTGSVAGATRPRVNADND
ncbi:hypothetical protein [Paraburkholderia acidiphila]|uniref:Alpha/beta hydrolase family protein n=1 Tax=Paraburkholderia acidiphila TaxID=2571747 RepID=A0A7Z2JB47_9BURK|nr:hypothetical protein [Paraburkholderia acidiphila]QGZ58627.1 hypothetical protein FAZ97_26990 [Paraburkholderia acidiphila]